MNGVPPGLHARDVLSVSLVVEDLRSRPDLTEQLALGAAASDPAQRGAHLLDAACAVLMAGEPKRATTLIDEAETLPAAGGDPRLVKALRTWALQLDVNWYPGNIGSEVPKPFEPVVPSPGDPWTVSVEYVVASGPTGLLAPRAIIEGFLGQGSPSLAAEMANQGVGILQAYAAFAESTGRADLLGWCRLAQADLAQRTGRADIARQAVDFVKDWASKNGQLHLLALDVMMQGDWAAVPGSWPETLGYHLAPSPVPRVDPPADLELAGRLYDEVAAIAVSTPVPFAPRLLPSLAVRRAAIAWLRGDAAEHRKYAAAAQVSSRAAGATALAWLMTGHLFLADVAEGKFAPALADVGSGWSRPTSGRLAELRQWAETVGSTSWCAGIGRLLQRAGDAWRHAGETDRAALAYRGALFLQECEPGIPSRTLATAVAGLDISRNLHARATVQLERIMAGAPVVTDPHAQMTDLAEELEVLVSIIGALQPRLRVTGEAGAQGLLRVRRRLERLQELARGAGIAAVQPGSREQTEQQVLSLMRGVEGDNLASRVAAAGDEDPLHQMLGTLVGVVDEQLAFVDFLVPFARAEDARRRGLLDRAEHYTAEALTASEQAPPMLKAMLLVSADRGDEARDVVARLAAAGTVEDDVLADVALRTGDPDTAAAAFARTGLDPATTRDWHVAVTGLELALAAGEYDEAVALADHGAELFQRSVASLTRDVDRVAACDDPSLAALYTLGAKAHLSRHDADPPGSEHAEAAALMEKARSGAMGELLRTDQESGPGGSLDSSWREAAASWAAEVDDFLARLGSGTLQDPDPGLARVDEAEQRLLEIEASRDVPSAAARGLETAETSPQELAARLPAGALVIQYLTVGDDLLVAAIAPEGIHVEHRPVRSRALSATVRVHHERCADGHGAGEAADQLAELLLAPVADQVRAAERVVFVPFGPLNLVPIHALPFDGAPLGLSRVCSYAPTAALAVAGVDGVLTGLTAAVVGDPAFDAERHPRLRRLPGAASEARLVAARTSTSDALIDTEATEPAVRDLIVGRDIVHLATHGSLNELGPYSSSLVLAGPDELTVSELVGMRVAAQLAVLSACDTGRGAATLGGDVVGLTRALISAGVQHSVVSLWPVDDVVACVTMAAFYDHLASDPRPAFALARAQADVHGLGHASLLGRYDGLCAEIGTTPLSGFVGYRRGELDDDEPIPEPLGGDAERYWAPFVLISAVRASATG